MALANKALFHLCPLPNVPVEPPVEGSAVVAPETVEEGRGVMREVVARRLRAAGLDVAAVVHNDALDFMITGSGGVLRDLVRLVHRAARLAHRSDPRPECIDLDDLG